MNRDVIKEKVMSLKDISLEDWGYVKDTVDEMFRQQLIKQQRELEKKIKLSNVEMVEAIIRSKFG